MILGHSVTLLGLFKNRDINSVYFTDQKSRLLFKNTNFGQKKLVTDFIDSISRKAL